MPAFRPFLFLMFLLVLVPTLATTAFAGPPFVTDDPEPVEYRHWEVYVASQLAKDKDGWSGTAPHFEVNYGAWPGLQRHLITPLAYVSPNDGPSHYGFGDLELGAKYCFIQETDWRPRSAGGRTRARRPRAGGRCRRPPSASRRRPWSSTR